MLRGVQLGFVVALQITKWTICVLIERLGFSRSCPDLTGRILASMLERMGPTFIKLGQALSSRPDLVSVRIAGPLTRLRTQITPLAPSTIVRTIEESFGLPLDQIFLHFRNEPLATGGIAQVHLATLKHGPTVAVKVQKPALKTLMERDFVLLRFFGLLLERVPGFRDVPFRDVFGELEVAILSQLDFELEADNNGRFQQNLRHRPNMQIPRLFPELCNRSVITMEYESQLIPVEQLQLSAEHRRTAAKAGLQALYQMIFADGLVHADLHPGNVFFRPNGEIVILDFGLVASLDDETRERFREFFFAMATNHGSLCARIIQQTAHSLSSNFDALSFTEAMKEMVDRFAGRRVQDFEVARFATELFDLQRRFGIRSSTAFTMTIISLLLFEGILKTLDPEMDFQAEASAFILASPSKGYNHDERAAVFQALRDSWHERSNSELRAGLVQTRSAL